MSQERPNLCHAAIYFEHVDAALETTVRAATGIDLASVRRRIDVPGVPITYEFDLIEAIADASLIILTGDGPLKPNEDGTPIVNPTPINVQRAIGDTTGRRFWVLLAAGVDTNCWVEFVQIPTLDQPRTVTT